MVFSKANFSYFIAFLLVGGILGTAIGVFLGSSFPALTILKQNVISSACFDLVVISISFNINPITIVGIISGIVLFYKV